VNEIVAVALISGGASLLGASVGALTTYKVNLRNTEATIATSKSQHEVELARMQAENQRLQESNREEERRNRQSTYHQHLRAVIGIYQLMGLEISVEQVNESREDYTYLHAGVLLFAPSSVRTAASEVSRVYNEVWSAMERQRREDPGKPEPKCWRDATAVIKDEFGDKIVNLIDKMHADVTRGIAQDPEIDDA
jgi:hypothetical protein